MQNKENEVPVQHTPMTWKAMKEFVNQLPEERMDEQVRWWGIDCGGFVYDVAPLEEDHLQDDDFWVAATEYVPVNESDEPARLPAGTPIIYTEF